MSGVLVRIVGRDRRGRWFCAGLEAEDGRVVRAAPILRRHTLGKTGIEVAAICTREGWTWTAYPYDDAAC